MGQQLAVNFFIMCVQPLAGALLGAVKLGANVPIISNHIWSFSLSKEKAILWSHATNVPIPEKLFFFFSEILFRGYSNVHCFLGDLLNLVLLAEALSFATLHGVQRDTHTRTRGSKRGRAPPQRLGRATMHANACNIAK